MNKLVVLLIAMLLLSGSAQTCDAAPAWGGLVEAQVPVVVDGARGWLYVVTENESGGRKTAALSAIDGTLVRMFDAGGPMALDSARGRLYVSTASGVVVVNVDDGRMLRTLPAIPAATWQMGGDFLPPLVMPNTGEVLVVVGPEVVVFAPEADQPTRKIPFTSEGFTGPNGELLTAGRVALDETRGLLYGSFLVHSQTSSGIGGSFTVDEISVLDVMSGQIRDRLEAYNLNQMAVDPVKGNLLVNMEGDARVWAGGNNWLAELRGIRLAVDQNFQVDSARRRLYARVSNGPLVEMDLDSLSLTGAAWLSGGETLAGYDTGGKKLYLIAETGRLSTMPVSAFGNTFTTVVGDWPAPDAPVRALSLLPDGRMTAEWGNGEIGFSADGGNRWNGKVMGGSALSISPQFASDGTMLVALGSLGVFRSDDRGQTWRISSAGLRNFGVDWIVFSPNYAADRTVYLYARVGLNMFGFPRSGELYRSQDSGRTWQAMPVQPKGLEDVTVTDVPNMLVGVRADGPMPGPGLFSSSPDQGITWQEQGTSPAFPVTGGLSAAPLYGKWGVGFVFGTDGVLYRSQDFGATWSPVWAETSQGVSWGYTDTRAAIAYGPDIEVGRPVFLVLKWNEIQDGAPRPKGMLDVSADGGLSWGQARLPGDMSPTAIAMPDDFAQSGRFYLGLSNGKIAMLNWADVK